MSAASSVSAWLVSRPLPLGQRALRARLAVLHDLGQAAPGSEAQQPRPRSCSCGDPLADRPGPRRRRARAPAPSARSSAISHATADAAPRPARSFISVVSATFQPLPTPPTTFSSGIRASSMKSSLNSASPVIWRSGRTWTRLLLHVHEEVGQALVLGRVLVGARDEHAPLRVVRERGPDLLAGDDPLAVRLTALVFSDARSEPASGSEKPWHQISSPVRIGSR